VGAGSVSPFGTLHVQIEVIAWITTFVGGSGSGRKLFEEAIVPGETVGDLLWRLSQRFPELDSALWDASRKGLGEHIEVLVNDVVLGVTHTLESPLQNGDRMTLLGQFMGG
jgi:molybdopterin converting factor small subunit